MTWELALRLEWEPTWILLRAGDGTRRCIDSRLAMDRGLLRLPSFPVSVRGELGGKGKKMRDTSSVSCRSCLYSYLPDLHDPVDDNAT